ncbi:MAG TPA: FtsQ-type POTRA domain-containing protein [Candidatus Polarisedimenticolaceae bacterium]|nr:FtsQ-type POTRA domain-containing protein [Candidatus Polarisedimenticolaceae bacterium]
MIEGGPFPEPDRRYWRRRVNRHVRKARRARRFLRWAGILASNLAVGAVLVVSGASVARHVVTSSDLAVRTIVVEGTMRTTPKAVEAALSGFVGRNLVELDLDDVASAATRDPWVREASVKRMLPGTLRVSIVERAPGALALLHGAVHVIDDRGVVMGPAGPGLAFDLPLLSGLDRLQGRELEAALARGVGFLTTLHEAQPAWSRGISELDLSRADRVTMRRVDGGPELLLDPERIDRNVRAYLALQPTIARKIGEARRVDLRWSRRISILPAGDPSVTESE